MFFQTNSLTALCDQLAILNKANTDFAHLSCDEVTYIDYNAYMKEIETANFTYEDIKKVTFDSLPDYENFMICVHNLEIEVRDTEVILTQNTWVRAFSDLKDEDAELWYDNAASVKLNPTPLEFTRLLEIIIRMK